MKRKIVVVAAAVLALTALPAVATGPVLSSTRYGAVDFGDQVAYRVDGLDCEGAAPRVVVTAGGQEVQGPASQPRVDGVDPTGCTGAATVPSFKAVSATGWRQGDALGIELRDGDQRVPLRYFRIEADHGQVAAGAPVLGPAGDQDTADNDKALTMSQGDSVGLGRVDVRRVDAVSLRLCIAGSEGLTSYAPFLSPFGPIGADERIEPPVFVSVRQGSPTGPALVGPVDVSSNPSTELRLATEGFGGCYRLLHLPVTGRMVDNAPELFVTVDAAPPGVLQLNSVDIDGTAAKVAAPREVDPAGMTAIFDGSSWAGWTQSGCLLHDDGSVSNQPAASDLQYSICSMRYDRPLQNVVMRFDVRRRSFFDNGEIDMPTEIQLRSVGEFGPGGYFLEYAARAEKLNAWPDWSHVQIAQLGARYVVTINGRTVTDHLRAAGAPDPYTFGLLTQPQYSYRFGGSGGFGHEASPDFDTPGDWGDFWFRNVRVLECAGPADPACVARADANLGQAPQR